MHPVFVRYFFEGGLEAALEPVLKDIEARLSWRPQSHLPMRERIVKAGHALLTLKEIEHLGAAQPGGAIERLPRLLDHLLRPLEQEWVGGRREPDTAGRVERTARSRTPPTLERKAERLFAAEHG